MATIKLQPLVEPPQETPAPELEPRKFKAPAKSARKVVPSDWNLTPLDGDHVVAANSNSGEKFEGTIAEFNAYLKGS